MKHPTCGECKFWYPNKYPNQSRDTYEECYHPEMEHDSLREDGYIRAGGYDGYGDLFQTTAKFGCILFESKL